MQYRNYILTIFRNYFLNSVNFQFTSLKTTIINLFKIETLSADETVCNESQKSSTNSRTPIVNPPSQPRSERTHLVNTPHNGAAHRNSVGMLLFFLFLFFVFVAYFVSLICKHSLGQIQALYVVFFSYTFVHAFVYFRYMIPYNIMTNNMKKNSNKMYVMQRLIPMTQRIDCWAFIVYLYF